MNSACRNLKERMTDYKGKLEDFKEELHTNYEIEMLDNVDATITEIAAIDINNYTTENIIGVEKLENYQSGYNTTYEYTSQPNEISINDVLTTGSYSNILEAQYNDMLEIDPEIVNLADGEVLSIDEYIESYSYMESFDYSTVKDIYLDQCNKIDLIIYSALILVSIAALLVPGGGLVALSILSFNAALTAIDVGRATYEIQTGKDLISSEALDTGDKELTGIFAALDVAFLPFDIGEIAKGSTRLASTGVGMTADTIGANVSKFLNMALDIPTTIKNSDIIKNVKNVAINEKNIWGKALDNIREILGNKNYSTVGDITSGKSDDFIQTVHNNTMNVDNASGSSAPVDIKKIVDSNGVEIDMPTTLDKFNEMHPNFNRLAYGKSIETWYIDYGGTMYFDSEGVIHYVIKTNDIQYDIPYRIDGPVSYDDILTKTGKKLTGTS